jgi:prepilin-type N-terminal cleavage/methylation domain-containing protein
MRRGLALIECLVVVVVIVILACLLLPGLVRAQDKARDVGCTNNMKQMGLALHNYHSVCSVFPMSAVAGPGRGRGQTCFTAMLPFAEQARLYNSYNFSLENWHAANSSAVGASIDIFLCPQNRARATMAANKIRTIDGNVYPGESQFGRLHYGANWGGERAGWGADFEKDHGTFRGVMMTIPSRGPNGENTNIAMKDITDGLAFTLAIGEKRDSYGWCVGGWGGSEFDPGRSSSYDEDDPIARRVYTGSYHESWPHFTLCDGSTRTVPGTIDRKIWYALITRDGGETITVESLTK